ncbi:hypothetical protein K1T71_003977 [Dendrolimus kikuchii]|uniref:Uncharacterized protein n=1 Tax=Dendrolimus kikuchii TaxID=765133 RepID=A0ACC1D9I3_9NEOP|nr:hypothetical protein K1T71_003977 [Dendrolimus kikuchii]
MDREDGEMSDDSAMLMDTDVNEPTIVKDENFTLLYKANKNGLEIKTLEKVDASRLEERAKRFGLNLTGNRVITQSQIDELYENCGIESGNERHFRFDALHLTGIDGLSTKELFQYLEDYKPISLEWVDDISCNIVCQDHISAALALLVHSREIKSEELKNMLAEKSDHHWREGMPHPKKDLILMRFATNSDKKMAKKTSDTKKIVVYDDQNMDSDSKNPWGDLCKSWGVYDHQEVFQRKLPKNDYEDEIEEPPKVFAIKNKKLAMRLGKRKHRMTHQNSDYDSNSDSEWRTKSKTPRMRMHADDEESKIKKKKKLDVSDDVYEEKYAPLSIEVVNSQGNYSQRTSTKLSDKFKYHNVKQNSVHNRLGGKIDPTDYSNDDSSSERSDANIGSRVQKVRNSNSKEGTSSVWSRLEGKQGSQSDLRQVIKSRVQKKPDDLRERISKTKKSNLRIEIDNNISH